MGFDLLLAAIQDIRFAVRFVCMEYLFQAYAIDSICLLLKTVHIALSPTYYSIFIAKQVVTTIGVVAISAIDTDK